MDMQDKLQRNLQGLVIMFKNTRNNFVGSESEKRRRNYIKAVMNVLYNKRECYRTGADKIKQFKPEIMREKEKQEKRSGVSGKEKIF